MFKTKVKFDGSSLEMRGFDTGFLISAVLVDLGLVFKVETKLNLFSYIICFDCNISSRPLNIFMSFFVSDNFSAIVPDGFFERVTCSKEEQTNCVRIHLNFYYNC